MTHKGFILASLFLLSTTACGDGGGGSPVPVEEFFTASATVICTKAFECCTTSEITERYSFSGGLADEADCIAKLSSLWEIDQPDFQESIASGNLIYHSALARDCFNAMLAATCEEYAANAVPGTACETFLEGLVADAAACAHNDECVSGYCEGASDEPAGVCKALPGIGSSCPNFECTEYAFCDPGSERICVAKKADGEVCDYADECSTNACSSSNGNPGSCGGVITICNGL